MYKKSITYTDFDGKERIEDIYFNLTKTELIDFALDLPDNVSESIANDSEGTDESKAITKVMSAFTSKSIFKFLKDLILKSYGVRKDEGRRFAKVDENGKPLSIEFAETMAFEAIMEMSALRLVSVGIRSGAHLRLSFLMSIFKSVTPSANLTLRRASWGPPLAVVLEYNRKENVPSPLISWSKLRLCTISGIHS